MFVISWIKNFFSSLLKAFKEFIMAAFSIISKELIAEFKDFAVNIVSELNNTDLANEQKRKEAFDKIKEEAKNRGKDLKDGLINSLIELAVQYVKNNM